MIKLKPAIKLLRPTQWIKNGFVFMPLVFSGRLFVVDDILKVGGMCLAFCLASSATYVLNDYIDVEQDRVHPLKKTRPLASGAIAPFSALVLMVVLLAGDSRDRHCHTLPLAGICIAGRLPLSTSFLFGVAQASGDTGCADNINGVPAASPGRSRSDECGCFQLAGTVHVFRRSFPYSGQTT